jgi:hypothetical protein
VRKCGLSAFFPRRDPWKLRGCGKGRARDSPVMLSLCCRCWQREQRGLHMVQFAAAGSSTKANILPLELTMAVNIEAESARAGSRLPSWFDETRVQGIRGSFSGCLKRRRRRRLQTTRRAGVHAAPRQLRRLRRRRRARRMRRADATPPVGRQVLPIEYGPINLIVCNVAPLMRTYCRRPTRHDMEDGTCHSRT